MAPTSTKQEVRDMTIAHRQNPTSDDSNDEPAVESTAGADNRA
jgi:hypothetical protein